MDPPQGKDRRDQRQNQRRRPHDRPVADRLADPAPLTPQVHSQTRHGGRGLALVEDLSEDWGTTRYAGGKTVWFRIPVASRSLRVG